MTPMHIKDDYFEWMMNIVGADKHVKRNSYRKLLDFLNDTEFTWKINKDSNRAEDGKDLRWRFSITENIPVYDELDGPCSVLEMMIALALRCEETLMDNPSYGNRTSQWFWKMIVNLGLGGMIDELFDKQKASDIITRFLKREYEPNGRGGLFTVLDCKHDMRRLEIWLQLNEYLDDMI